jgi:hypothetical protein
MGRALVAAGIAAVGLFASVAGQAVWRQSPDEIWAACAVVGVLSGMTVAFEARISKALVRVTRR